MTTKNLELTEDQALALHEALLTESSRLADFAIRYVNHPDAKALYDSCARCRKTNEYLRGRVAGLLAQF